MIGRLVAYSVGSIVAVLVLGTLFQDRFVTYRSEASVLIFGIALGALSTFIKPLLLALTLPISCLTFGLFSIIVNAALFGLAALITPGLDITFWGCLIGAVFASITNGVVYSVVEDESQGKGRES